MLGMCFFNNKGGVGKTTLACNVPAYLAEKHRLTVLYRGKVMPVFEKLANGQNVLATDEDALLMAGILESLSTIERINEIGQAIVETPGRKVRTFVSAGLSFPSVELL